MKFIIYLLVLISIVFSEPEPRKFIPPEQKYASLKKDLLECIVKDPDASEELKKYATEQLNDGLKETLILTNHRNNGLDRGVIRKCRRQAFKLSTESELAQNK